MPEPPVPPSDGSQLPERRLSTEPKAPDQPSGGPQPSARRLSTEQHAPAPPARRLSTEQMEAVVRRAVELQARESDATDSGITSDELLRIGGELGIEASHMRRALAEVAGDAAPQAGVGSRLLGAARTSASRAVPGDADAVRQHIERYLLESQYLAVLRRLPDRTVYEKAGGFQVDVARAMDAARGALSGGGNEPRIGAGFDLRTASSVEVAVAPLEPGFSWVTLITDLGNQRTAYWASINVGGGLGAFAMASVAAVAIAPPAALVALPIMGASAWAARASYGSVLKRARMHLEALLDHLERGESLLPRARLRKS
jgi:hypothetical protein